MVTHMVLFMLAVSVVPLVDESLVVPFNIFAVIFWGAITVLAVEQDWKLLRRKGADWKELFSIADAGVIVVGVLGVVTAWFCWALGLPVWGCVAAALTAVVLFVSGWDYLVDQARYKRQIRNLVARSRQERENRQNC